MQYFRNKFWDIRGRDGVAHRRDNVIYVIFLTLCLFYFPKGSLPERLLTQHDKPYYTYHSKNTNIHSISNSKFRVPFVGCFSRMTVTFQYPNGRLKGTRHLWGDYCSNSDLNYRLVKQAGSFQLYYFSPFMGPLKITHEMKEAFDDDISYILYAFRYGK